MPKRITVSMVAERAGVSRGVVYAVLNPDKQTNIGVSEVKREAVRRALDELGYIPDMSARALASGRTSRVGILMSVYKPVGMRISSTIQEELAKHSYAVLQEYHQSSPERELERLKLLYAHGIDALVISRTSPQDNGELLDRFLADGIRVICLGDNDVTNPQMDCVAFDSAREMRGIVTHTAACGYRRVAYLGFSDQLNFGVETRGRMFRHELTRFPEIEYCGDTRIASFAELRRYAESMRQPGAPELIVCFNDELADALVKALMIVGIRVPEEIGVTGIDGVPDPMFAMPLTTMRLPINAMAEAVCEVLAGKERGRKIALYPELIPGGTTRMISASGA